MMEGLLTGGVSVGIQMILAMSVNIISGYARKLSLGQAAFAALGAYTSALLTLRLGLSFWLACPLSIVLTGSIGFLLGLPLLRMPQYYLLIMTLILNALVQHLLRYGRFVGGYFGLGNIAVPHFLHLSLASSAYFPLVLVAVGLCLMADCWFRHSRFGQLLRDVESRDVSSDSSAVGRAILAAFVTSTAMAGLGGSLFAHFETFISPFDFNLEASLFVLASAACGGLGSPLGALLGALMLGGLLEIVRPLAVYRLLVSGAVFLLVGLWMPRGLLSGKRMASAKFGAAFCIRSAGRLVDSLPRSRSHS